MARSNGTAGIGSGDDAPELYDERGLLAPAPELVLLRVPDSSAVATDPRVDGRRRLRACCDPHLARLAAGYQRRPFVVEELWVGQITRAVRLPGPLDEKKMYERVVAMAGLDEEQLMRALAGQDGHGHSSGAGPGRAAQGVGGCAFAVVDRWQPGRGWCPPCRTGRICVTCDAVRADRSAAAWASAAPVRRRRRWRSARPRR
ncbi:hypothetical protein [Kitasatospora sp. NPDC088346]|uniref:hypothetical protein n=1 Tax=Kitasatospora sp. NPDC088346 TaxID=3364073 RepID=UPI0037F7F5DA